MFRSPHSIFLSFLTAALVFISIRLLRETSLTDINRVLCAVYSLGIAPGENNVSAYGAVKSNLHFPKKNHA